MRKYVAAYMDSNIEETTKIINNLPKKDKVVKIYGSPSLESIQEQVHYARAQGFSSIDFLINELDESQEFVKALNDSYGYMFKEGIGLVRITEAISTATSAEKLLTDLDPDLGAAHGQYKQGVLDGEAKHTMYVLNPIGLLPFARNNHVCEETIRYIKAAKEFIERYSHYCGLVYIADIRPMNDKLAKRFDPAVYRKRTLAWLKSDRCKLDESEKILLIRFLSDDEQDSRLAIHKEFATQDATVKAVGEPGNYLFGPDSFWTNLTGFHGRDNSSKAKYNVGVNNEYLGNTQAEEITKIDNLTQEPNKYGFYYCWGPGAKKNILLSIETIADQAFDNFKNCCRELAVNKVAVPTKELINSDNNATLYLASIISYYIVDKAFRIDVDNNKKQKVSDSAKGGINDFSNVEVNNDPDYWNTTHTTGKEGVDLANRMIDKYALNKEIDGEKWVDKTIEKMHNRDTYFKGKLGLDTGDKYNYKDYEKKARELGVDGYELYKLDKRMKEIDKEIDEYLKEVEELQDSNSDEIAEIKDLNRKIEELKQERLDLKVYIDKVQRSDEKNEKMGNIRNDVAPNEIENSEDFTVAYNRCIKLLSANYHQLVQNITVAAV